MKKKLILLAVIAALLAAGYVAWDHSYTDTISEKDLEQASYWMNSFGYGASDLQVRNLYDKHDHAKYLYAYSKSGFVILYKNGHQFIEGGQGLRFTNYLSDDYKLYYFAPMGYCAGPADMSFKEAKAQGLLHNIHQEEMNAQNLYGRTFVWEKGGFGGDFTITLNEDGTYEYYAGYLSSYIGQGNWTVTGSELTMTETSGYDLTFHFTIKEDELIYIAEGSSKFAYVTVEDGDRFIGL